MLAATTALAPAPAVLAAEEPGNVAARVTDVALTRWFTASQAGGFGFDPAFARSTWAVDLASWRGEWGMRVGATIFGTTGVAYQAEPYVPAFGALADLQVLRRMPVEGLSLGAGLRALTFKRVAYAALEARYQRPLAPWLDARAALLGGANVSGAYVLDGSLGARAHWGRAGLTLGYRLLDLQCGCVPPEPPMVLGAPYFALDVSY